MSVPLLFVVSSPRSGSTMLERMLESHSAIKGGPEPHLLTPLAHLGVWANVDKAPYDHVLAAESQKLFVDGLPNGESDYWRACRAYCDVLYGQFLNGSGKTIALDKTPAYALILPFMAKVFPDAKYIVLTRHPIATFSSFANSFFDGNYEIANQYNPILNRYVPALAAFLRQSDVSFFHIRYENLVQEPEVRMQQMYEYIGVPYEADTVNYGDNGAAEERRPGLGDPIGVHQHSRPTTAALHNWVEELATDTRKYELMETVLGRLDPEDLATLGYPFETLWEPLERSAGTAVAPRKPRLTRYRLQRKLIVKLRSLAQSNGFMRNTLRKIRLAADVLLREQ